MAEDDLNTLRPRQSNFFKAVGRDPEINSVARDRIVARAVAGELELSELRHKLVSRSQQESINGLRIEGQRFAVDEARRVAQRERDEVAAAGLVADSIRGILDNDTLSDEEKRPIIKRMEFEHRSNFSGSRISRGPNNIFNSAEDIVGRSLTPSEIRLQDQTEKSNEYRRLTLEASLNKQRFDASAATLKSDTEFFNGESKFIDGLKFGEAPDPEDRFGEDVETDAFEDKASLSRIASFVKEYHDFDPETAGQYELATSDRARRAIALNLAATVRANLSKQRSELNTARSGSVPPTTSKAVNVAGVPTK